MSRFRVSKFISNQVCLCYNFWFESYFPIIVRFLLFLLTFVLYPIVYRRDNLSVSSVSIYLVTLLRYFFDILCFLFASVYFFRPSMQQQHVSATNCERTRFNVLSMHLNIKSSSMMLDDRIWWHETESRFLSLSLYVCLSCVSVCYVWNSVFSSLAMQLKALHLDVNMLAFELYVFFLNIATECESVIIA